MKKRTGPCRKAIALAALFGMVVFLGLLILTIVLAVQGPLAIPSAGYWKKIFPYALSFSGFIAAILFASISDIFRIKDRTKRGIRSADFRVVSASLLAYGLMGGLIYLMIIDSSATILHRQSIRRPVTLEVTVTSAWPTFRNWFGNCPYSIMFDDPRMAMIPFVCVDRGQWEFFRANKPIKALLFGTESDYGYELKLCE